MGSSYSRFMRCFIMTADIKSAVTQCLFNLIQGPAIDHEVLSHMKHYHFFSLFLDFNSSNKQDHKL